MAIIRNTNLTNVNDLIFYLDAVNPRSYSGSGSVWNDLSPNGNHFTLFNTPTYVQNGTIGTYLTFNGTNQYARSANAINFNQYSAVTIEIGYRSTVTNATQILYETTGTGGSTATGGITLLMNANNTSTAENTYLSQWQGYGSRLFGFTPSTNTSFNSVVETFVNGADSTGRQAYVNGTTAQFFTSTAVTVVTSATTAGLVFANTWTYVASRAGTGNFFRGDIAYIRAWGRKLTTSDLGNNVSAIAARQPQSYIGASILTSDPSAGGGGGGGASIWPNAISGDNFPLYTPSNIVSTLGAGTIGANSLILSSSFMTVLLNGQGRGITGTAGTAYNSSNYQITYDPTGTGTFNYTAHRDFFQPGTPYEIGIVEVGGITGNYIGGQNQDALAIGSTSINNGTVRSWKPTSDRVVVWFSGGSTGDAIFQYYITGRALRIHMSYFNTTGISRNIRMARGGDPDYNGATANYNTNNTRVDTSKVYATSPDTGIVFAIYCPGNGYTKGTAIRSGWGSNNPCTDALNNTDNGNGDNAIYAGVDCGTVAAGGNVGINFYYCFGTSSTDAYGTIGV